MKPGRTMQGHSIHEFPQTGQKDICMAVVKYTLFVLLDGAGSQKNQHQSVVGVARGYKVGNCTPGVTDKMSVVAGGGRASPRAAEALGRVPRHSSPWLTKMCVFSAACLCC